MSTAATTEPKPAAPAVETITVKVDGKAIAVPKTMRFDHGNFAAMTN